MEHKIKRRLITMNLIFNYKIITFSHEWFPPSLSHSCWLALAGVKRSLKELRGKATLHHFLLKLWWILFYLGLIAITSYKWNGLQTDMSFIWCEKTGSTQKIWTEVSTSRNLKLFASGFFFLSFLVLGLWFYYQKKFMAIKVDKAVFLC